MTSVGIIGYRGRMGAALDQHLSGLDDLTVGSRLEDGESLEQFLVTKPDVAVDLSNGPAVGNHGPEICRAGIPYIIGATGIADATLAELRQLASDDAAVLVVPNFSIGACLMMEFATRASKLMQDPVITERHHKGKLDAPSGTALHTARQISAARGNVGSTGVSPTGEHPAVLGGDVEGVRIHSIRGDGYLAEQQVMLSLPGESLEISHRSIDRRCFMEGIVLAIRNIHKLKGFNIGLGSIMEL